MTVPNSSTFLPSFIFLSSLRWPVLSCQRNAVCQQGFLDLIKNPLKQDGFTYVVEYSGRQQEGKALKVNATRVILLQTGPSSHKVCYLSAVLNHLTPNGHFSGRNAPLTSRCCILYIYSTNIRTEYFKHAAHSQFFLFKMTFIS